MFKFHLIFQEWFNDALHSPSRSSCESTAAISTSTAVGPSYKWLYYLNVQPCIYDYICIEFHSKDAPVAHNVWAKYYRHFHFHSFQCFQESFPKWFEDTLCAHIVRATQVMSKLKIQNNSEMWKKTKISSTCMPNFSLIPSKLQHRNTQLLTFHSKTLCTDQPYALRRASKFVPLC